MRRGLVTLGWIVLLPATPVAAQVTHFGNACAGGSGMTPSIGATGDPCAGCGFTLDVVGPPLAAGLVIVGASDSTWEAFPLPLDLTAVGLSACELNVSANITVPLVTDGVGAAGFPVTGWSACQTTYFQAFTLDPSPSTYGGMSQGMAITATCPAVFGATVGCSGGQCTILACDPGFYDCDGSYENGCEATTPCGG